MSWTSVGTIKGPKGDTGEKGDTGQGSDEEAGWKLPVDQILTTNTLPTGVSRLSCSYLHKLCYGY